MIYYREWTKEECSLFERMPPHYHNSDGGCYMDAEHKVHPCSFGEMLIIGVLHRNDGDSYRRVAEDMVDGFRISTAFMPEHYSFDNGHNEVFETMIFQSCDEEREIFGRVVNITQESVGFDGGDYLERCGSWDEALLQHQKAIKTVKARILA